jgi:Uma2 family endonuclease
MNIAVPTRSIDASDAALPPRRRFTVDDVWRMIDAGVFHPDERYELIDGDIYPMNAKKSRHEGAKLALNKLLVRAAPDVLRVGVETSLFLGDDTFVNPDLTVFLAVLPSEAVRGPDLVLLVEVSATSLRLDREVKAPLYARYGVPLFWLVDAGAAEIWAHSAPVDGQWGLVRRLGPDDVVTLDAIPGLAFRPRDLA